MAYYRMRVHVQDQDGNAVKDVKVSMPGTAYPISHTDSSGNAYFYDVISGQQFKYVATAPYGYTCITCTSYNTLYGNSYIVLKLESTIIDFPISINLNISPSTAKVGERVTLRAYTKVDAIGQTCKFYWQGDKIGSQAFVRSPTDPNRAYAAMFWTPTSGQIGSGYLQAKMGISSRFPKGGESSKISFSVIREAVCPKPYIESIGFSPASPKVGDTVSFWRTAEGGGDGQYVTARKWDFGDGRTATTSRATHAYASAGTYTVRYTVTNNCGESTYKETVVKVIEAVCPKPYIESIGFSPASPKVGDTVSFWRTAEGGGDGQYVTARKWDFGDGRTATTSRATHAYTSAGTYTVRYTVTNNCGESTYKEVVVEVKPVVTPEEEAAAKAAAEAEAAAAKAAAEAAAAKAAAEAAAAKAAAEAAKRLTYEEALERIKAGLPVYIKFDIPILDMLPAVAWEPWMPVLPGLVLTTEP